MMLFRQPLLLSLLLCLLVAVVAPQSCQDAPGKKTSLLKD